MKKHELLELVDWGKVMDAPRYAGGHEEVMNALFGDNARVAASWVENDYQGDELFAYAFGDGSIAIIADSFGSCSGCDAWEDASDNEARNLVTSLISSARLFPDVASSIAFCEQAGNDAADYWFRNADELLENLRKVQP